MRNARVFNGPVSRFTNRPSKKAAPRSAPRPLVEPLENRMLLNGFNNPTALGDLLGGNTQNSSVPAGGVATYSLNMVAPGTLYFRLRAYNANAAVDLYTSSNTITPIAGGTAFSNDGTNGNFFRTVPAGHYFIQVASAGLATNYLMRATADYAGQTLGTARNIGNLQPGLTTFSDEVGASPINPFGVNDTYKDLLDVYKFTLNAPATVSANASIAPGFTAPTFKVHVSLAKDTNNNGTIDAGETIASSGSGASEDLSAQHLGAGTYYFLVDPAGTPYPNYTLSINDDLVADTAGAAKNIGTLFGQQQFTESVAHTDGTDYYKFTLEAPATVTASLSGLTDEAGIQLNTGANTPIIFSNPIGSADRSVTTSLAAGTYYAIAYDTTSGYGTNYTMQLTADYAGNGFGVPRVVGAISSPIKLFQDFVGPSDSYDYYQFTIASNNQPFEASVGNEFTDGFFPNLNPTLFLNQKTGSTFTPIASATKSGPSNILLATLNAGTYQLIVASGNAQSGNYSLALQAPADLAGNDLPHAKNVGTIAGHSSYSDFVGTADPVDTFKFTMAAAGTFSSQLFTGVSNVFLQLVQDKNNNGTIDTGDIIAGSFNAGNGATQKVTKSLAAGNYFIRVRFNSGPPLTYYQITLDANYAGTTLNTARDFGTLTTTHQTFSDEVDQFGNPTDFYKFTLSTAGTLSANLTYNAGDNTVLELIQDKNHNGVVDAGDILVITPDNGNGSAAITKALASGTYFLGVKSTNGGSNYSLTVHR